MNRLFVILCGIALTSCSSTKPGKNDHRYPEARASAAHTVRFASTDGRFVGLSDGSLWNIDWSHSNSARQFRAGQPVKVKNLGGGSFPYQLSTPGRSPIRARFGKKLD